MKKSASKKTAKTTKPVAKKAPAKKAVAKKPVVKKVPEKKAVAKKPVAKKVATKMCKCNPQKKCCGKKDCTCNVNFGELIEEIFGQLRDMKAVENLLKDFFFTELLKRGFEEAIANAYANKIIVDMDKFEANFSANLD